MICVITPTRGRRANLVGLIESIDATARGRVTLYVGVDDDDASYDGLIAPDFVVVVRGPAQRCGGWANALADIALGDGQQIIGFLGDDHRPRTRGWDDGVRAAMKARPGLVYCDDGLQGERLPTAPFWDARVIRALGWYFFPGCVHLYADDYWLRLATDLRACSYLPGVLIEHMHPAAGKAEPDAVYAQNDSHYAADQHAFAKFLASGHREALERVVLAP